LATLDFGELLIELISRDVHCHGELISQTAKEFDLLAWRAGSPRRVFAQEQLLDHVWDSSTEWQDPTTVNEHIHRLRRKLEVDPRKPRWVMTIRGAGYSFTPWGEWSLDNGLDAEPDGPTRVLPFGFTLG
tara:strand:+ start:417 stop:806 length:390 start_codon:yes stop_codon:yes gene_type:complete